MSKNISDMKPDVQHIFTHFTEVVRQKGIPFQIIETYRSQETQDAYYAQGRKDLAVVNALRAKVGLYLLTEKENTIITRARISNHFYGKAMDAAPFWGNIDWDISTPEKAKPWIELGQIAKECGLQWGGDWEPKNSIGVGWDFDHFEV